MIYLLDTNIISETIKPSPNEGVIEWLSSIPIYNISISVITIGEIRKEIELISDSTKKYKIMSWLEVELMQKFLGRIIHVDETVAARWGHICAHHRTTSAIDGLIAASAMSHNLKLVTRNVKNLAQIAGLEIINPWDFSGN